MREAVTLGEIVAIEARQVDPTLSECAALPHVGPENIEGGTGRLLAVRTAAEDGMTSGKYLFEAGDILYSKIRPYLRKAVIAPFNGLCSADVYPLRVGSAIADPQYLLWLLLSEGFTRYANECSGRARMPKLNREQLLSWRTVLPSLADQRRLAARLAGQLAAVERARAAATSWLEAAAALPPATLVRCFGEREEHGWPARRISEVTSLPPSRSVATDGAVEVTATTTACLSETGFVPSGVKRARMNGLGLSEAVISVGEVLIARSNTPALVGRAAVYAGDPAPVVASDLIIRIAPGAALLPEFLGAYLSYLFVSGYWKHRAGGASGSMKKITRTQVASLEVPVPPVDEQARVVSEIQGRLCAAAELRSQAQAELAAISALPAALLREAFNSAA